jgi:hypothetical protein
VIGVRLGAGEELEAQSHGLIHAGLR